MNLPAGSLSSFHGYSSYIEYISAFKQTLESVGYYKTLKENSVSNNTLNKKKIKLTSHIDNVPNESGDQTAWLSHVSKPDTQPKLEQVDGTREVYCYESPEVSEKITTLSAKDHLVLLQHRQAVTKLSTNPRYSRFSIQDIKFYLNYAVPTLDNVDRKDLTAEMMSRCSRLREILINEQNEFQQLAQSLASRNTDFLLPQNTTPGCLDLMSRLNKIRLFLLFKQYLNYIIFTWRFLRFEVISFNQVDKRSFCFSPDISHNKDSKSVVTNGITMLGNCVYQSNAAHWVTEMIDALPTLQYNVVKIATQVLSSSLEHVLFVKMDKLLDKLMLPIDKVCSTGQLGNDFGNLHKPAAPLCVNDNIIKDIISGDKTDITTPDVVITSKMLFVTTLSTLLHLLDDSEVCLTQEWYCPIIVKEFDNGKRKVAYIEKPLRSQSNLSKRLRYYKVCSRWTLFFNCDNAVLASRSHDDRSNESQEATNTAVRDSDNDNILNKRDVLENTAVAPDNTVSNITSLSKHGDITENNPASNISNTPSLNKHRDMDGHTTVVADNTVSGITSLKEMKKENDDVIELCDDNDEDVNYDDFMVVDEYDDDACIEIKEECGSQPATPGELSEDDCQLIISDSFTAPSCNLQLYKEEIDINNCEEVIAPLPQQHDIMLSDPASPSLPDPASPCSSSFEQTSDIPHEQKIRIIPLEKVGLSNDSVPVHNNNTNLSKHDCNSSVSTNIGIPPVTSISDNYKKGKESKPLPFVYSACTIGAYSCIVRGRIHGVMNDKKHQVNHAALRYQLKLECQPHFGCEVLSHRELCHTWLHTTLLPDVRYLRVRCNVFTGAIMHTELETPKSFVDKYPDFRPEKNLNFVSALFSQIAALPASSTYVLSHAAKENFCRLGKVLSDEEYKSAMEDKTSRGMIQDFTNAFGGGLHQYFSEKSPSKRRLSSSGELGQNEEDKLMCWYPIDTSIIPAKFRDLNLLPATFNIKKKNNSNSHSSSKHSHCK